MPCATFSNTSRTSSLSPSAAMARRRECRSPRFAHVMILSTSGRISLARDSTVLMRSFASSAHTRLFFMALVWLVSVPSLRPFL